MVIFHSYVSLPEGKLAVLEDAHQSNDRSLNAILRRDSSMGWMPRMPIAGKSYCWFNPQDRNPIPHDSNICNIKTITHSISFYIPFFLLV